MISINEEGRRQLISAICAVFTRGGEMTNDQVQIRIMTSHGHSVDDDLIEEARTKASSDLLKLKEKRENARKAFEKIMGKKRDLIELKRGDKVKNAQVTNDSDDKLLQMDKLEQFIS